MAHFDEDSGAEHLMAPANEIKKAREEARARLERARKSAGKFLDEKRARPTKTDKSKGTDLLSLRVSRAKKKR